MLPGSRRAEPEALFRRATVPFMAVHLIPLLAIFTGVSRRALVLAAVLYVVRLFFITAGYHRYFSHRSYRLGRASQAVFAFGGGTAVQKGPLWWAANHRAHHRYTDTDRDPHSPQRGFWWSHVGWILSDRFSATDFDAVGDLARYPELRWLDKHDWVPPWTLGLACFLIAGWSGLVVGFFASTILLWHMTFAINSVAHLRGSRRFATTDSSRNNALLALVTFGEGWHNNHHHHPRCTRQGLRWWELDITYGILRILQRIGIVRDIREPPPASLDARRIGRGTPDIGMIRFHLSQAASIANRAADPEPLVEILEATDHRLGLVTRANIPAVPQASGGPRTGPPDLASPRPGVSAG